MHSFSEGMICRNKHAQRRIDRKDGKADRQEVVCSAFSQQKRENYCYDPHRGGVDEVILTRCHISEKIFPYAVLLGAFQGSCCRKIIDEIIRVCGQKYEHRSDKVSRKKNNSVFGKHRRNRDYRQQYQYWSEDRCEAATSSTNKKGLQM